MTGGGRKILLIDGHSLAYRAFFALPVTLTTTGGQPTNAVYGFVSMLLKVIGEEKPDAVVVAFDGPRADLLRTREYPPYKAHRPSMPDELRGQIEMIEHLLGHMKIPLVSVPGHEADDVLGTVASRVASGGGEALIVTGDRDALQLVRGRVGVLMTGKGITETVFFDERAVLEKYGVPPEKLPDVAGLKGDASDNIPGVPGIGEKGATDLIRRYGSLEAVYEHVDEITGAKRKIALEENRKTAFLSRKLATLNTDLPIDVDLESVRLGDWDEREVLEYLYALEFKTLAGRFQEMFGGSTDGGNPHAAEALAYTLADASAGDSIDGFVSEARRVGGVGFAAALRGSGYCDVRLEALALATGGRLLVASRDQREAFEAAASLLESAEVETWLHDGKAALQALDKEGVTVRAITMDTAIAAYLENPSLGVYNIEDVWERNLGGAIEIEGMAPIDDKGAQPSLLEPEPGEGTNTVVRAAAEAAMAFHLCPVMAEKLRELRMDGLAADIELPLMSVLGEMEKTGVALDALKLEGMSRRAASRLEKLENDIFELAGHPFNIGSTRQLATVLFEELGLPATKKTKTGYSTDSSVLESLKDSHQIAGRLIEYRENAKLKSTYFDVLPTLVCRRTGRVHCTFNQTATATGRISSSGPNLQNIPVRTEVGRMIREAFVPPGAGWKMLVADYSQIELRVLAHMSGDPLLLAAFERDADIHAETAAMIFGVDGSEVTAEMRRMAKVVNFGIVYGMGYYGLSSRLGISMEEATAYIDTYFGTYEGVRRYRDSCVELAAKRGYSSTLLGRRRFIPELASSNRQTRELGERIAVNTPLQGTAADIIKKAMVDVARAIEDAGLDSRMTMQIHDELIFDVAPLEVETIEILVRERMTRAVDLEVELKVDSGVYDNWGQAKQ